MSRIISNTQSGFLKGRDISECTRFIHDLLHHTKENNIPGILVLLDYEKAFDSVDRRFINKTLNFFGFGESIVRWVEIFYKNSVSCIINNGHCSEFFSINRGVRQGDPMSSHIFLLVVEILAAAIKYHPDIRGIKVDNSEFTIVQYADDTTLTLSDDDVSLNSALNIIEKFSKVSGLNVNFNKTEVVWIGVKRGCMDKLQTQENLTWNFGGKFKLLGIQYDLQREDFYHLNVPTRVISIKKILNDWSLRDISIIGKITVLKSLVLPILVQNLTILPNLSPQENNEIQSLFYKFTWNGKPDKIKRNLIIQSYENGGLKLPHIKSFEAALKMSWIRKLIDPNYSAPWKTLILPKFQDLGGDKFWLFNPEGLTKLKTKFNLFWQDVITAWCSFHATDHATPENIMAQPIWLNKNIKIDSKPIFYKRWTQKGIFFINDLLNENGSFYSSRDIRQKYNLQINILEYLGLLSAIPQVWKNMIKNHAKLTDVTSKIFRYLKENKKVTKYFTALAIEKLKPNSITSISKWNEKLGTPLSEDTWLKINNQVFQITDDTILRTFQFKINNNILYTNDKLYKFKIIETEQCTFCKETKETLLHHFWECHFVKTVWLRTRQKISEKMNIYIDLKPETFIFNLYQGDHADIINLCLLLIKKFIFNCRCKGEIPTYQNAMSYINYYKDIDLQSCLFYSTYRANKLKEMWLYIDQVLLM